MQIHELPAGTLSDNDVIAADNGGNTRKLTLKTIISNLIADKLNRHNDMIYWHTGSSATTSSYPLVRLGRTGSTSSDISVVRQTSSSSSTYYTLMDSDGVFLPSSTGTLSFASGVTDGGSVIRKCGTTVTMTFIATNVSATGGSWKQIGTVPTGYRPTTYGITGVGMLRYAAVQFQVTTAGAINIRSESDISANQARVNLSWTV